MGNQYYTFEQFATDVEKIARAAEASGRKFKSVWGPARGALPLAVCLSHRMNLELVLRPPLEPTPLDASLSAAGYFNKLAEEVLIVDDVADTGKTLAEYKHRGFFIATLFKHPKSSFEPNVWLHEKGSDWIVFWWESLGPLTVRSMPLT